jgi:membrane protein DedA with SNARE-associated domain
LAATGDLVLIKLILVTLGAFILGDQTAYYIGKKAGPAWLDKLRKRKRLASVVTRSESIYEQYGVLAILLSRTIFSPCGPYIAYLSGVWQMKPVVYTAFTLVGASIWTMLYVGLGYLFAGQIPELTDLVSSILLVGVSALFTIGFATWLSFAWQKFSFEP